MTKIVSYVRVLFIIYAFECSTFRYAIDANEWHCCYILCWKIDENNINGIYTTHSMSSIQYEFWYFCETLSILANVLQIVKALICGCACVWVYVFRLFFCLLHYQCIGVYEFSYCTSMFTQIECAKRVKDLEI